MVDITIIEAKKSIEFILDLSTVVSSKDYTDVAYSFKYSETEDSEWKKEKPGMNFH